jgi:hypothetical protein
MVGKPHPVPRPTEHCVPPIARPIPSPCRGGIFPLVPCNSRGNFFYRLPVRDVQRIGHPALLPKDPMACVARSPFARLARFVLLACVLVTPALPQTNFARLPSGELPSAGMYPEVRLRKLHLVRPDLIPYPIAYEVCC